MMPEEDWESINDDWAEHDLAKGHQNGDTYPVVLASRYGKFANLADFVRKAQLANYEAFRAMYEGRNAEALHPNTGIITWMSNPAQPSFVWQLYHYDLEPNSSFFAVMHASEMIHIQFNEADESLQVINNLPQPIENAVARVSIYSLDGTLASRYEAKLRASASLATTLGPVEFPPSLTSTHFLKLELINSEGKIISSNFYWRAQPGYPDVLTDLNVMPTVQLDAHAQAKDAGGKRVLTVTVHNSTSHIALMVHLQLRKHGSGERLLPAFYSDNYISLVPNETREVTIEADANDFGRDAPLIVFDGWNVTVAPSSTQGVFIAPNIDAQPEHWPATELPFQTTHLR